MILVDITYFECDQCKVVFVCRNEETWKVFEDTWTDSLLHHFCPECSMLPAIQLIIEQEKNVVRNVFIRREAERKEVLDAEFIG